MRIAHVLGHGFLILTLACPTAARATGYLGTECDGTTVTITLDVFNDYVAEWAGRPFVVRQYPVGTCGDPIDLTDPAAVMPDLFTNAMITFTAPAPQDDLYYAYELLVRLADGSLAPVHPGRHASGCGQASGGRGTLTPQADPYCVFTPCGGPCWEGVLGYGAWVDVSGIPAADLLLYADGTTPLDIFGTGPWMYPMPGAPSMVATSIAPAPGGDCGAIGTEDPTWGGMKALYR